MGLRLLRFQRTDVFYGFVHGNVFEKFIALSSVVTLPGVVLPDEI